MLFQKLSLLTSCHAVMHVPSNFCDTLAARAEQACSRSLERLTAASLQSSSYVFPSEPQTLFETCPGGKSHPGQGCFLQSDVGNNQYCQEEIDSSPQQLTSQVFGHMIIMKFSSNNTICGMGNQNITIKVTCGKQWKMGMGL